MIITFSNTFSIILPDALNIARLGSEDSHVDETEIDAIDIFCTMLTDRQMVNRVNDQDMIKRISKITRNVEAVDNPSGHHGATRPKVYAMNCPKSHLVGDTYLRHEEHLRFPVSLTIPLTFQEGK